MKAIARALYQCVQYMVGTCCTKIYPGPNPPKATVGAQTGQRTTSPARKGSERPEMMAIIPDQKVQIPGLWDRSACHGIHVPDFKTHSFGIGTG